LQGHRRRVRVTAYAPGSGLLATASQDGTVRLWNVMDSTCLQTLPATMRNPAAAFTADGGTLAWRAPGRRLRLWDLKAGQEREPPRVENPLRRLFAAFDLATAVFRETFDSDETDRICLATHPADGTLAVARTVWGAGTGSLTLWDTRTGTERECVRWQAVFPTVAVAPGGKLLATASRGQAVQVWDVETGEELVRLRHKSRTLAVMVAFSPTGDLATTAGRTSGSGTRSRTTPGDAAGRTATDQRADVLARRQAAGHSGQRPGVPLGRQPAACRCVNWTGVAPFGRLRSPRWDDVPLAARMAAVSSGMSMSFEQDLAAFGQQSGHSLPRGRPLFHLPPHLERDRRCSIDQTVANCRSSPAPPYRLHLQRQPAQPLRTSALHRQALGQCLHLRLQPCERFRAHRCALLHRQPTSRNRSAAAVDERSATRSATVVIRILRFCSLATRLVRIGWSRSCTRPLRLRVVESGRHPHLVNRHPRPEQPPSVRRLQHGSPARGECSVRSSLASWSGESLYSS
jgi:hypothetical protein